MQKIEIPIPGNRQEQAAIFLPLRSPFIVLPQGETVDLTLNWEDLVWKYTDKITPVFNLEWGHVVYHKDEFGKIAIAGYHYDTSD